ncbi:MAG: hypothetical protein AAB834_05860 [Patescibacteria group bacterium]
MTEPEAESAIVPSPYYEVNPAEVCGAVFVDAAETYVPVVLAEMDEDNVHNSTRWNFIDSNNDIRACLLRVVCGSLSSARRIRPDAAEGAYYERYRTVYGMGHLVLGHIDTSQYVSFVLPFMGNQPLNAGPGETVSIYSGIDMPGDSTYVLATFPGAPFKPEYEAPIPPLVP